MKREDGFYWVRFKGSWIVAEWSGGIWISCGLSEAALDSEWEEIDERRLTR